MIHVQPPGRLPSPREARLHDSESFARRRSSSVTRGTTGRRSPRSVASPRRRSGASTSTSPTRRPPSSSWSTAWAPVSGLEDRLEIERAGLRAFFAFAGEHRRLYRIIGQAEFVDEEVFRRYHDRLAEGYIRGLEQAMDAGQIQKLDPEIVA